MSYRKREDKSPLRSRIALPLAAVVFVLAGSIIATNSLRAAEAALIPVEEHWKYNMKWTWDPDLRRTIGIITPQIVMQNVTEDRLEGYIADANGTRLEVYDGEQAVLVKYQQEGGLASSWIRSGWVQDGYFAIEIPQIYRDVDNVRIYIGNHQYTVDNGTPTTPQSWVYINSAMTNYAMMPDQTETAAETTPVVPKAPSPGSLIDMILSRNSGQEQAAAVLLPVRSTDPGK